MNPNTLHTKRMTSQEFVAWVEARCDQDTYCRLWQFSVSGGANGGAPVTTMLIDGKRKSLNVRREYFIAQGRKLPRGWVLVPTCRNPRCLEHLQAMTRSKLNALSAFHGGRQTPAVRAAMCRAGRAKSTVVGSMEVARKIRALRAEGKTYKAISEATGVPLRRCFDVCSGRTWSETLTGTSVFAQR